MGARIHGKQGLIYLSGSATPLEEASVCNITEVTDSEEGPQFGDKFASRAVGIMHWGGSISAWASAGQKTLFECATAGFAVGLMAYPDRNNHDDYYSGNIVLSFEHGIDIGSLQAQTASFEGDGTLAATGFA